MHRLESQLLFPEEVKINRVQNPSAQQPLYAIPSVVFRIGGCKLGLVFYRPLVNPFLQITSSPNPLLSSAAEWQKKICLFFFFSPDSFFLFFSSRVKGKEIRLMAGGFEGLCWATGTLCLCLFFTHVEKEPQFLLGKTISWCFCHPLTSSLVCGDC